MKKQLIVAGIATAVGVTGLAGVGVASAAADTSSTNPMSSLVEAVATKFNLKEADVQAVFDAQRTQMQAEREAEVEKKVAQLVTDGKLTQDQADKLNAKRAELQKAREALKDSDKTREEMKTERETKRTELEAWAKENGIDTEYLRYVVDGGHHGHRGMRGFKPTESSEAVE